MLTVSSHSQTAGIFRRSCGQSFRCNGLLRRKRIKLATRCSGLGSNQSNSCNNPTMGNDLASGTAARHTRRSMLLSGMTISICAPALVQPLSAKAGLVRFPAKDLNNRYILVRAGENVAEAQNYVLTNPVWKTSQRSGLSRLGRQQVAEGTLSQLNTMGVGQQPCWIWASITQDSYQSAEMLAYELGLTRDRIVPEYSFLDRRGLGALEGFTVQEALQQVRQGDAQDAQWRPVRGFDGTPNESASDVLVRMRQMLSVTETQYFDDDIVFVAPDSDTLSILQAGVLGIDLTQHHKFAFRPGEARQLELSTVAFSSAPATFTCPDPPHCLRLAPSQPVTYSSIPSAPINS